MIREKIEAESMIPAAKPRKMRLSLGLIDLPLKKRTKDEPSVVHRKMSEMPITAFTIGDISLVLLIRVSHA